MLATPHALIGAAIGGLIQNPAVALIAGVLSHHLFDYIPHWDPGSWHFPDRDFKWTKRDWTVAVVDNLIVLGLFWGLYFWWQGSNLQPAVLAGAFGAILPDVWHNVPFWNKITKPLTPGWLNFHRNFHQVFKASEWWKGLLVALATSGVSLFVLISMR